MSVELTHSQLEELLLECIPAKIPVLVTGEPGIGKTSVINQVAKKLGYDAVVSNPAVDEPTDNKGIPWPSKDGKSATFIPIGNAAKVLASTRNTLWFFDDLGQAGNSVQASVMPWFLQRENGGHRLPDHVALVGATNDRTHRAGAGGLLEPVKSRFGTIVKLIVNPDQWCSWAVLQPDLPPVLIAYIRFSNDSLCNFQPSADLVNSPLPRTWENAGKLLNRNLSRGVEAAAVAGAVGAGEATKFLGFVDMWRQLPSIDGILLNPDIAPIPTDLGACYAVVTGLAAITNEQNIGRVAVYLQRLADAGAGDFAALAVQDACRRSPTIQQTPEFVVLMTGDVGKLVSGTVN